MRYLPLLCLSGALLAAQPLPLDGTWRFQLDPAGAGVSERWFARDLSGAVKLPGALAAQGIGDDVQVDTKWIGGIVDQSFFTSPRYEPYRRPGNVKVPFWLQPDKYYAGLAWYQRDVEIPAAWKGSRVLLTLERPHWQTRVWLDDREIGAEDSLSTPHRHDLGSAVAPGRHRLTIRVDNSLVIDIGINSHSVSDHTQGNWNGIAGRIELAAASPVYFDDLRAYPDVKTRTVRLRGKVRDATGRPVHAKLTLAAPDLQVRPVTMDLTAGGSTAEFSMEIALGDNAPLWDEFSPALHRLRVSLSAGEYSDQRTLTVGLRDVSTAGTQLVLNGRKIFLRGTLECAIFPRTGHPPTDVDSWRKLLSTARAFGLNHIRFHSWCPPEAAFQAADEMGFYFEVESSVWANQSTTIGDGKPVDEFTERETARILAEYGNHPSFLMLVAGNEPGGKNANAYLAAWVQRWKTRDPRRLYSAGAGWPQLPENQFHLTPDPRIQAWGAGLNSRINGKAPETVTDYRDYIAARAVPVVSHEIGQWCVYPDFDEIPKYTGYLKAKNFEIFRDWLNANHMGDQARQFLLASGKLQTLCYKEDIESALRTPGMGGFELLQLHDFPGQGTALVGVLSPFWETKGYVTGPEFSRFSGSTVPLVRLEKRVFTSAETLTAALDVSHFGPAPLPKAVLAWKLVSDSGQVAASGKLPPRAIPVDGAVPIGRVSIPLASVPAPARYKFTAGIEGTSFENDWDVWVYPPKLPPAPPRVTVARSLDAASAALRSGGAVLLAIPPNQVKGNVQLGFSSIFWNTAWTNGQAPHTLGILCDPEHPAFASFPTDYHSNWQWWYVISNAAAMILDPLPASLRPVVQVIDDWFQARRLALVFEAKVGPGKLLVTSIDLDRKDNPVIPQLRSSLLAYIASPQFQPKIELTLDQVKEITR
jgi:hypothetical protein